MVDIIDFNTKATINIPAKENTSLLKFIEEIVKAENSIEALMVCVKYENNDIELFRTENFDIRDRSYMLQLIQSDISEELAPSEYLELEPDV